MKVKVTRTVVEDVDVWEWLGMLSKNDRFWEGQNSHEAKQIREIWEDYNTAVKQYHELVALKPERLSSYAVQFDDAVKLLEKRIEPFVEGWL